MKNKLHKSYELPKRLLCTILVLIVFMIGRNIVVYGVDVSSLESQQENVQNILISLVSGDRYQCSIFALGITPYITSSILLMLVMVFFPKDVKKRISKQKTELVTTILSIVIAVFYAVSRAMQLEYVKNNSYFDSNGLLIIAILSFTIGALIIIGLIRINKDHGIGQQLPIIVFNIVDSLYTTISGNYNSINNNLLVICASVVVIAIVMENTEVQIPIQRVSIDNEYANKNYLAFKLNPIGVMPIMFSTTIFILVKYLIYILGEIFPNTYFLVWASIHMNMTETFGIISYLVIVILFTILFSFLMLSPSDLARNLQRGGDSIVNVYAGKSTLRYLRLILLLLSTVSGFVMASCMGISLMMSLQTDMSQQLAMLPSSLMMLVSMFANLFSEINGYHKFDSYKFFI